MNSLKLNQLVGVWSINSVVSSVRGLSTLVSDVSVGESWRIKQVSFHARNRERTMKAKENMVYHFQHENYEWQEIKVCPSYSNPDKLASIQYTLFTEVGKAKGV